jgi:starch synthase
MYSMRYGTVPIVHAVGGLADTVVDGGRGSTGIVFRDYAPTALLAALKRALALFGDLATWRRLQQAGMARDFSWDRSAEEYVKIYDRATIEEDRAP